MILEFIWKNQFSSVALYSPMDCSTPGLPIPHHLPKFAQVHVHCISDATKPSHPLTPPTPEKNILIYSYV